MPGKTKPLAKGVYSISSNYRTADRPDHRGTDYAAPAGTPIYAAADGVVVRSGHAEGFGCWIVIDHQPEHLVDTVYGHMFDSDLLVRNGDTVRAGDVIARVGSNGQSSGPHLHFEVWGPPGRFGGVDRNPAEWLAGAADPGAPVWVTGGSTVNGKQFKADIDILTTADSGKRDPKLCQFWCLHTTENTDTTPPDNVARWQQNRANESSYNILVGTDGRTVRGNDDDYRPWSAGPTGNDRGLHLAFVGFAARTPAQWLAKDVQLHAAARVVADWCERYNIPTPEVSPKDLRKGMKGGCGHADVSDAWHEVDHRDPGLGFPWGDFVQMVREAVVVSNSVHAPHA